MRFPGSFFSPLFLALDYEASYLTNICVLFSQGWILWLTELNEACYLFSQGLQSEKREIKTNNVASATVCEVTKGCIQLSDQKTTVHSIDVL